MNCAIEFEQEDDGRWIAEIPSLPGVMAYGVSKKEDESKNVREEVYGGCNSIAAMQDRFSHHAPSASALSWTITPAQAEHLADAASDTRSAIKALCFRLRWSDVYEQGRIEGENKADLKMMTVNQERFEDDATPPPSAVR